MGRMYYLRIHRSEYVATCLQFVRADTGFPGYRRGAGDCWFCGYPTPNRILFQEGLLGSEDRNSVNDGWNIGHRNSDCVQTHIMTIIEKEGIPFENTIEQCEHRAAATQRRLEK